MKLFANKITDQAIRFGSNYLAQLLNEKKDLKVVPSYKP